MGELTKPELRSRFRSLRAAALPATEAAIQAVAARELTDWLKTDWLKLAAPGPNSACGRRGHILGLYWPLAGEADLRSCLQQNFSTPPLLFPELPSSALLSPALPEPAPPAPVPSAITWSLALPAIASTADDPQLGLRYRPWRPVDPLAADHCGIAAPLACPPLPASAMAALLLPCLALDGRGLRLGYGGGWFDRLRAQPGWRAVPALGVLPAACLAPTLPQDPWDVPLDGWIDENGLHWF
jgi:5-formyltetrahydrofolate cyclo-ligase